MIDPAKAIWIYEQEQFKMLNDHQRGGLADLLMLINADTLLTDPRWIAYVLATTFHETAGTWQPIAEYGKGKGRVYGKPDERTGLVYYGRGYTQNTWFDNYMMLTRAWNKSHPDRLVDFTTHPDLLLVPEYSYWAMSYGMRNGSYTGVGLPRYFNADRADPVSARKIINGTDKAALIAGYYDKFMEVITNV